MKKMALYAIVLTLSVSSCTTYTATGAAFGGVIGSAIGGLAGGPRGSDIGTLVGVATGAAVGAAADARQMEEAERRQREYEMRRRQSYDDVYSYPESQRYYSDRDDEKARRIRQYHENVERKYGGNGFSYDRTAREHSHTRSSSSSYSSAAASQGYSIDTRAAQDSSGRVATPQYDDRIEMK